MSSRAVPLPRPDLPDYHAFERDLVAEVGLSPRSADTYARTARLCIDWLTVHRPGLALMDVAPDDLRAFLRDRLDSGRSRSLRRNTVFALRHLYDWLGRDLAHPVNPARLVRAPAADRPTTDYYTTEQFARLLDAVEARATAALEDGHHRRWLRARFDHAVLATFRFTGVRVEELINLRVVDVGLADRRLRVERGKGGRERYLPIAPPLVPILDDYLERIRPQCPPSPWLFANPAGLRGTGTYGRVTPRAVFDVVRRYAELAELPGRHHPHRLRHGVATELVRHKADPTTVQRMLGHADLATTARYLHLDDDDLRSVIDEVYGDET